MRFIKPFIFGITGLFIMITLLSLLIPSKIRVSRATVINTTSDKIYPQIADLKNWKNWHPMFKSDSAIVTFTSNKSCDIIYNNKPVHLQVTHVDTSSIKFTLTSGSENEIDNELFIVPIKEQGMVEVQWHALTKLHWYPWDKFYGIFIDKLSGSGYEQALEELKLFAESN